MLPRTIAPGDEVVLTFAVPNVSDAPGDTPRVAIAVPPAFELEDAGVRPGWTARLVGNGTAVSWRGGSIPPGQFELFSLRGKAPRRPVTLIFTVLVAHTTGSTDTFRPSVIVEAAPAMRDEHARDLGGVALAVAIAAGAIAVAGGFLALWLWLRPPPLL